MAMEWPMASRKMWYKSIRYRWKHPLYQVLYSLDLLAHRGFCPRFTSAPALSLISERLFLPMLSSVAWSSGSHGTLSRSLRWVVGANGDPH